MNQHFILSWKDLEKKTHDYERKIGLKDKQRNIPNGWRKGGHLKKM